MILVVGHGPSANVDPEWIDAQDFVVRLFTGNSKKLGCKHEGLYTPHVGTKTDAVCCTRPKPIRGYKFWYEGKWRKRIKAISDPYTERKLSTGTSACVIAHLKFPDEEIGVIGFDTNMAGIYYDNWPYHDAVAEGKLLRDIGVKDYGNYGEDV